MNPWWTDADAAELDVLVHELALGYAEHRERCESCSGPCPILAAWREHIDECKACGGVAPLTYGLPCRRYDEFIEHGQDCAKCNPCPSLAMAVGLVVEWRETRSLLSKAEWLRAEQGAA